MEDAYKVYARTDGAGRVVEINSDAFLTDTEGWMQIAEGYGDRYHHAQGHYLPEPLMDDLGVYRYKLQDGEVVTRTAEEMAADYTEPEATPSQEERIAELEEALDLLLSGVTE